MSDSLESGLWEHPDDEAATQTMTLAEAAERLDCQVETLRKRIRKGLVGVRRGPHGRYYIDPLELPHLGNIRRTHRRTFADGTLAAAWDHLETLVNEPGAFTSWQRRAFRSTRTDGPPDGPADVHLFHLLGVHAYATAGLGVAETADQLSISTRQVRRLRRTTLMDGLLAAYKRAEAAERGRLRVKARPVVRDLQRQLQETGFRPARRNPRLSNSGARDGVPARVVVVRKLTHEVIRRLRSVGITEEQLDAIGLIGIGPDELNELVLGGPWNVSARATHPDPNS